MRFTTQVLLPIYDNLGVRFSDALYRAFEVRMMRQYRGWTRTGEVNGAWQSPAGEIFIDEHVVYEISHSHRELQFWRREKEKLKSDFDQQEIWIMQYEGRQI